MARQEDDEFEDMQDAPATPTLEPTTTPAARAAETPGDRAAAARTGGRRERAVAPRNAGTIERAGLFWRDVRAELKRVAWPTLKEVQQTTIITIIAVIFFAAYLWGVDRVLTFGITQLENVANRLFG